MKHEEFKVFIIDYDEEVSSNEELLNFINSENVTPKSLSVSVADEDHVVVIGYQEAKSKHHYGIEVVKIHENDVLINGIKNSISDAAKAHDGVVCLDVHFEERFLKITFLVAQDLPSIPNHELEKG